MYLSRFRINGVRRGARHLLQSPQRMHAAVLSAFPPLDAGTERVLWRVDQTAHDVTLYIVGPRRPDLSHLVEQAGWPTTETWQTASYGGFLDRLVAGQRFTFRLTANPVHAIRKPSEDIESTGRDGRRGRVTAHVSAHHQEQWLLERSSRHGFLVDTDERGPRLRISRRTSVTFRRGGSDGTRGREVSIAQAQFDGVLEVTDPDTLRSALTEGIGRAKAYGCGLLTLAPTT